MEFSSTLESTRKDYPATSKQFTINNQTYIMQMVTLGLQAKLEDDNIEVTYLDLINECTNIPNEILEFIPDDQLDSICEDIINYSSDKKKSGGTKKAIELIAWFMNNSHMDAQYYRLDFVRILIDDMIETAKAKDVK